MNRIFKVKDDGVRKTYSFMGVNIHRRIYKKEDYRISLRASMLANSVAKTHFDSFHEFKNCNKGNAVALIATGPSLSQYVPIKDVIYVGVNKAFLFERVELDYLFIQDYNARDYICRLLENKYRCQKFFGILPQRNLVIPESLALKLGAKRYYTDEVCKPYQFTYDISTQMLGDFNSVVFLAMQFILWTNPDIVYLIGCDCSSGYYDNSKSVSSMSYLKSNWIKLKQFQETYYPDIKIVSINPVGLRGIFYDEYQNGLHTV